MFTTLTFTILCHSLGSRTTIVLLGILLAVPMFAQDSPSRLSGEVVTPAPTADTDSTRAPLVLTLQDALARAKANDPQYRSALTDLGVAHQDTVQSRAQLLPNVNYNMQYIYTQGTGVSSVPTSAPAGRYIENKGVHEYIARGNLHQCLSPGMLADYRRVESAEARSRARSE